MSIAESLDNLNTQRNNLVTNLNTKGVSASNTETLSQLVPKVLEIQTGGSGSGIMIIYDNSLINVDTIDMIPPITQSSYLTTG